MRHSRNLLERKRSREFVEITDFDNASDLQDAAEKVWPDVTYHGNGIIYRDKGGTPYYDLLYKLFPRGGEHYFQEEYTGYRVKKDTFVTVFSNDPDPPEPESYDGYGYDDYYYDDDDDDDEDIPVAYEIEWNVNKKRLNVLDKMEMGGGYMDWLRNLHKKFRDLADLRLD